MEKLLELIGSVFRDGTSLVLLGLGITFAPHVYLGGLFLALAGAAIARAWEKDQASKAGNPLPRENNFKLTLVVVTAFFVSTMVSVLVHSIWPDWSVQMVMAASGFASRWIVILCLNTIISLSSRGNSVASRLINKYLPDEGGKTSE